MVVVELVYLVERGRIPAGLVQQVLDLLDTQDGSYTLVPLDSVVLRAVLQVPLSLVPEMPGRVITATAVALGLPLLTADQAI